MGRLLTAPDAGRNICPAMTWGESQQLMARIHRDAERIATRFGLRYRTIEAERTNVKSRYGICYDDGTIKIRLRHATTGKPLKYSSLVSTLCHELAHLRHFNHGPRFRTFYFQLLEWSRSQGIYRPASAPRGHSPSGCVLPAQRQPREQAQPGRTTPSAQPRGQTKPIQLELF